MKENFPLQGIEPRSFRSTVKHLSTELQSQRFINVKIDLYILPQTLHQYWLTLVSLKVEQLKVNYYAILSKNLKKSLNLKGLAIRNLKKTADVKILCNF